jgi:hypothetical protein
VGWRLTDSEYKPIPASENDWYWSQELGLYLGVLEGRLRYFTVEGRLVPTPEEANLQEIKKAEIATQKAEVATQKAEAEQQRANQAEAKLEQAETKMSILAQKLRELNIDPDSL